MKILKFWGYLLFFISTRQSLDRRVLQQNEKINLGTTHILPRVNYGFSEALSENFLDSDSNIEDLNLLKAVKEKNVELVKTSIAGGANLDYATSSGITPIIIAAQINDETIVKLLLANAADPNKARTVDGSTPLHIAAEKGYLAVVNILLADERTDVNKARTDIGATPLFLASSKGYDSIVKLLIDNGANVNAPTKSGAIALHSSSFYGHIDIVNQLLNAGTELSSKTNYGDTAKSLAKKNGHTDVSKLIEEFSKSKIQSNKTIISFSIVFVSNILVILAKKSYDFYNNKKFSDHKQNSKNENKDTKINNKSEIIENLRVLEKDITDKKNLMLEMLHKSQSETLELFDQNKLLKKKQDKMKKVRKFYKQIESEDKGLKETKVILSKIREILKNTSDFDNQELEQILNKAMVIDENLKLHLDEVAEKRQNTKPSPRFAPFLDLYNDNKIEPSSSKPRNPNRDSHNTFEREKKGAKKQSPINTSASKKKIVVDGDKINRKARREAFNKEKAIKALSQKKALESMTEKISEFETLIKNLNKIYDERMGQLKYENDQAIKSLNIRENINTKEKKLNLKKINQDFVKIQTEDYILGKVEQLKTKILIDINYIKEKIAGRITFDTLLQRQKAVIQLKQLLKEKLHSDPKDTAIDQNDSDKLPIASIRSRKLKKTPRKLRPERNLGLTEEIGISDEFSQDTPKLYPIPFVRSDDKTDDDTDDIKNVIKDINNYLKDSEDELLLNIYVFFLGQNALSSVLEKAEGHVLIDLLKKLKSVQYNLDSLENLTFQLICKQIQTFEKSHVTLKNLVCLINCKPDDIKLYFGERIGTMVVELKQNNEKLAQTKYFDHLLELAQLLYANKNSFHRKIPGCGMTLNVHIYDNSGRGKLESLLNEYQLETLNKCLQCFIEKNKNTLAAEEYLIDNKYVLALFTIARKLFVFDSEKKLNIIGIYIDQGLIIESDDSQISTLKEMANNYNWHRARTSASGIWHGDIEIGLDRDLENTEKLGQAREWINQNSEMLINFLTLLQENMIKFTLYSCSEKKGNNQEKSLDPITKVYNNGIC